MSGMKNDVLAQYNSLKQYSSCLEEMITELDFKVGNYVSRADENKDKPGLVKNYLLAAEHSRRRLAALKAVMPLVDAELLHYLEILK